MHGPSEPDGDTETAEPDPWSAIDPNAFTFRCDQAPAPLAAEPAVQVVGASLSLAETLHGVWTRD